ncbi:MAG: 4-hydroxy-tetrahydrodipicolinate synthase [Candidatus Calescibacterium sp.]|nr:4-hydroxy-tetrahydrodipicolinate synthase [Candidatus Calescibacterium sp.]MCX7733458.1 4-hydroxy-tetrahydrodipicolinate synthase [bacterium]MDW8087439.1 4-hydroxy-tetrahydrodipicolinate synthase [Candidatus Calescibacterium sp.]
MSVKNDVIKGNYVALITPFKDGKIDTRSLRRLIDFLIEQGCDGIVPCGTTGEAATLDYEEHIKVIELTMEYVAGRVKVMAGTGSNSTKEAIELTKEAEKLKVDSVLLIAPYYNKPTQRGLYEHFRKIAEECSVPQVLYNIPGRTSVNIEAETVIRLANDCKNIVGIKEASGNFKQICDIIKGAPESFSVISGEDLLTLPMISVGARGVISATANVIPKKMTDLVRYSLEGKLDQAKKIHYEILKLFEVLFIETNPVPVKTAMYIMGIIDSPEVRLPLAPISEKNLAILKETLKNHGIVN